MSLLSVPDTVSEPTVVVTHTVIGSGIVAVVMGWFPQVVGLIAAFLGAVYYAICVWESKTVQHYVNNRRMASKGRKIARLKAKEKVIVAQLEALQVVRAARREAAAKVEEANAEAAKLVAQEDTEAALENVPPRK